jgi:hypothetical protein
MERSIVRKFRDEIEDEDWENGKFACFFWMPDGNIHYAERLGKIFWAYSEGGMCRTFMSYGQIPDDIQAMGVDAIRSFAEKKVREELTERDARRRVFGDFCQNPNYPLEGECDGVALKGRIDYTDGGSVLRVRLESPLVGTRNIYYSTGAHFIGHHILRDDMTDGTFQFTTNAVETAHRLLVEIYREVRHQRGQKPVLDLVQKLNGSTR